MRFDTSNFKGLAIAVKAYEQADGSEPLILIMQTRGGILHRFIIAERSIEKEDCDATGGAR